MVKYLLILEFSFDGYKLELKFGSFIWFLREKINF